MMNVTLHSTFARITTTTAPMPHATTGAETPPQINMTVCQTGTGFNISNFTHNLGGVNLKFDDFIDGFMWKIITAMIAAILVVRLSQMSIAHLRHLFTLAATSEQQKYWTTDRGAVWPFIKRSILYAPLGKKRHNREVQLSHAVNIGTVPSRFHTGFLGLWMAINLTYCLILQYHEPKAEVIAELRGRSGNLALLNMIPLFIFAGRNNPLIPLLRVSFDTYNLLHRWQGRIVVIESVVHTCCWAVNALYAEHHDHGSSLGTIITKNPSYAWGLAGTIGMIFLLLHSVSPIRHAFYETFLHLHQFAALVTLMGVYFHLRLHFLPQVPWTHALIIIWAADRSLRFARILYYNISTKGTTRVQIEALPGEACRLTFHLPRHTQIKPSNHVYVYLPTISAWMSHPFSVAWTAERATPLTPTHEKLPSLSSEPLPVLKHTTTHTSVSLVISARTGFTRKILNLAMAQPQGQLHVPGFMEGPYGGSSQGLDSYGTCLLFAGGVGITHQIMHVRHLLEGRANDSVAARKVVLVWSVRATEQLAWVRPWMDEILAMPGRREVLKILLFVTKPKSPKEVVSPSTTVQMFPGRANSKVIVQREFAERVGAMCVTCCGPGAFADDVRDAARSVMEFGAVDFIEEAFTW